MEERRRKKLVYSTKWAFYWLQTHDKFSAWSRGIGGLRARFSTIYEAYDHFTYCMFVFIVTTPIKQAANFNPTEKKRRENKNGWRFSFQYLQRVIKIWGHFSLQIKSSETVKAQSHFESVQLRFWECF